MVTERRDRAIELSPAQHYSGTPHANAIPAGRAMGRGTFLKASGGGVVLLTVAAGGVGSWRAIDQGVFATGEGSAYAAWSEGAGTSGGGAVALVRAAILAANAHDSQPWLFQVAPDRIELRADVGRNLGVIDPLRREMHLSLGCALENLLVTAAPRGYRYELLMLPNPRDTAHIATIRLRPGTVPVSPLYAAIPERHTNRGPYHTARAVGAGTLRGMQALNTVPELAVVWYTGTAEKQAFSALMIRATEAFIADRQQSIDDFAWWRGDWAELQRKKDGITLDASGLPLLTRTFGKVLPAQTRASNDQTWLNNTRNPQLSTAAAFGIIVARRPRDRRLWLEAGRLWQRMHLWGTTEGLAMQPLNQKVERAEREQTAGLRPEIGGSLQALLPGHGWHPLMPFRIGYPTIEALKSPRRSARDVTTTA